jgi:ABC-type glycerol-3-phosphate transport system substrate-binding protein
MKKLFMLLALCGAMVACNSEDKEEEKEKGAFDYYVEWMTASAEDDHEAYNEAKAKYEELIKDMSHKEIQKLYDDINRWNANNVKLSSKATSNMIHMSNEYEKSLREEK